MYNDEVKVITKNYDEYEGPYGRKPYTAEFDIRKFGKKFFFFITVYYKGKTETERRKVFSKNSLHVRRAFKALEEIDKELGRFKCYKDIKIIYGNELSYIEV